MTTTELTPDGPAGDHPVVILRDVATMTAELDALAARRLADMAAAVAAGASYADVGRAAGMTESGAFRLLQRAGLLPSRSKGRR